MDDKNQGKGWKYKFADFLVDFYIFLVVLAIGYLTGFLSMLCLGAPVLLETLFEVLGS